MWEMNRHTLRLLLETEFAKRYGRLAQIIQSNIQDFVAWDNDGIWLKPLDDINPERLVALKTYRVRQTRHGQHIKIELHDKVKACRILMAVDQAHGKRLDWVGVVVGEEPAKAAPTRPSACVMRAEGAQAAQLEDMTELVALFEVLDIEWTAAE